MSVKQPTLQQLPDDALILVMKHLAVDDLFTCRLVCKRLGGLALHPEIWSHRRLDEDKPCVCAVLGLAPCLDKVVYSQKVHTRAFLATTCAVRHLTLDIFQQGTECAVAGLAVRNQEALGRLISVRLQVCYSHKDVAPLDDADALLRTLVACSSGLESLDLLYGLPTPYAMRPVLYGPSRSSLKYFRCAITEVTETFVNIVLAGHAATLQEVDLGLGPGHCEKGTFQLFVGLSELRRLTCRVFPGMQVLASCKMLRDVSLSLFEHDTPETAVQGAVEFLRLLAGQLRTVSLEFISYAADDSEHFERLLGALACSGESLVEQLSIARVPSVPPLLRALPRLPALRVLSLMKSYLLEDDDGVVGHILAGITPATAPSLRRLELLAWDYKGCLHEWLHRDAVGRVLSANPSLHVHVWGTRGCKVRRQGGRWVDCDACVLGCHREATGNFEKGRRVGFFSHGPRECAHPEDHVTGDKWTWIHIRCNSD